MTYFQKYISTLVDPQIVKSSGKVAIVVGTLLLIINHGAAIWHNEMNPYRWVSALLSYVVPYLVSVQGKLSVNDK